MTAPRHRGSASPHEHDLRGVWYFAVTLLSVGLLAWVPFAHAATRLGSRARAMQAAIYAALAALAMVLIAIAPVDALDNPVGVGQVELPIGIVTAMGLMGVGCAQQVGARRQAYRLGPQRPADPAIETVLDARRKRAAARAIVAKDPLLAHELGVGRPDVPHDYDDGGLVDLNSAPAADIARQCELSADVAAAIVAGRPEQVGYLSVEDVFAMVDVPMDRWSVIRERAVTITLTL